MHDMNSIVGTHDILFITLDTLRYDVAVRELEEGNLPNLAEVLPKGKWEKRHSPGSFTYAAHHSFFAGFFPTPVSPGPHPRLFAANFPGSETTEEKTFVFDGPNLIEGLAGKGYHTICIGGVGFFNKKNCLASTFPDMFHESHWHERFGVTNPNSTENQVTCAIERYEAAVKNNPDGRIFLFINVSALHQPNNFYLDGAKQDSIESHAAALRYVDSRLPMLISALKNHGRFFGIICSDHGTTYGEDGFTGHRLAHETVWNVPYADFIVPGGL